jgi:hypothetical protein
MKRIDRQNSLNQLQPRKQCLKKVQCHSQIIVKIKNSERFNVPHDPFLVKCCRSIHIFCTEK